MASPKPTAKATIALGLVRVPVAVYPATKDPPRIPLSMVHAECGSKVSQRYLCERDNTLLRPGECGRAYEASEGRLLLLTEDDLAAVTPEPSGEIRIDGAFEDAEIEPAYVASVKRLGPDVGKGPVVDSSPAYRYRWLALALAEESKALLGRWATRGRDLLVAVRSSEGRLQLVELRRAEEIRDASEIEVPEVEVDGKDLDLGGKLIEAMELDRFDPGAYPDSRYAASLALLEEKLAKGTITISPPVEQIAPPVDLASAIAETLGSRKGPKRAEPTRKGPRRAVR